MYKHEMMKWREISSRLEKAYSTLYKQIGHFLNIENLGKPEMFRSYGTGKTILLTNHYFGHGIMLHLIIVSYNYTNSKHPVLVNIIDEEFGVLTNQQNF